MGTKLAAKDKKRINEGLRQKYAKVAVNPKGLFQYPTGRAGLETLKYNSIVVQALPEAAVDSYCGVGNPFTLGPTHESEAVLDIGCGGGVDTLIADIMVGPEGKVVGIDMVPKMLARARENLRETNRPVMKNNDTVRLPRVPVPF